jgi:5-methylcytosine-specific restriction endonuclease McrA
MANIEYIKKLRNPLWQRKRLRILARDNFKCQFPGCKNTKMELHVHHKIYYKGDPWEIPDRYLITYCSKHHKIKHAFK